VKRQLQWTMGILIISLALTGCQGTGQLHNFDPHALSSAKSHSEALSPDRLMIGVVAFQDSRSHKGRIGSRTHFWGGTTNFNVWDGNLGEGMADLAIEYLRQRNWQASRSEAKANQETAPTDIVLTGEVLSFEANAKSGFGFTDIEVEIRVRFQAKNNSDGSAVRMVLGANGRDTVALFSPKDVEHLTNTVAKDLFQQLFQDLTVNNRAFHLQSEG